MLNNKLTLLLLVVLASTAVLALIYNTDSRKDEYEVPYRVRGLGAGVAMLTQRSSLIGTTLVTGQTARQRFGVCATDTTRFMDDPSVGSCTGFLIAPDLLATAGTCVRDNNLNSLCSNIAVVFNYANTGTGITRTTFSSNEVFYCSSIVAVSQPRYLTTIINATTGLSRTDFIEAPNYAVIRLDRSVSFGISTYAYFRSLKNLHVNEKTYTIGHPLGLSKKYDDGGRIWAIDGGTTGRGIKFFSNSDTFTGSSGSPIFDADGRIIAMHASGNADFKMGRTTKCNSVISCPIGITQDDDDCWEGELGTSICYFAQWNSNIEDCSTAVGSKRNLPPGVNENIHRFNVTNPEVKAASDYYGVV